MAKRSKKKAVRLSSPVPGRRKPRTTTKRVQDTENLPPPPPVGAATPAAEIDEDGLDDLGLTPKQLLFAYAFIGPAGCNATRAAELAGYRGDNRHALQRTASETLHRPHVQRAISRLRAEKLGGAEWTRAGIVEIANTSLADFMEYGPDGEPTIDMRKAAEACALGVVKSLEEEVIKTIGSTQVIKRKIRMHDRLAALDKLARMNGLLKDRVEHTGKNGGPIQTSVEVRDAVGTMLADPEAREHARLMRERMRGLQNGSGN